MTDTDTNRQIVQEGLDRRAAQRAEAAEDAFHEAAERSMLDVVNRHTDAPQNATEATCATQADWLRTAERQARRAVNWNRFMERTFGSLLIPSIMVFFMLNGQMPIPLTIAAWIATGLFLIANTVAYALRNRTTREALASAWKRIVKKLTITTINRKGE